MKHYIILSYITGSGGVQCYVAAKAKYLEGQGWHVVVISTNNPKGKEKCLISSLDKYLPNGNPYQGLHPCFIPQFMVKKALKRYFEVIGPIEKGDEIIVESWNSQTALWGELIASKIHARHMFWTANEYFRKKDAHDDHCYEEKMDFYMFKMDRGEIFTVINAANLLFEKYRTYKEGDFLESFITEDPIQDLDSAIVNSITKADWNICYIGRSNKPYVPYIYDDVGKFARKHHDKKIQLIIVGEVIENKEVLNSLKNIDNLIVTELGDLYPIPRSLFTKIDVIIAGSGSARHSVDEGALVIIADPYLTNSHGLLGFDTIESVQKGTGAIDMSFEEALERALVEKTWMKQVNKWKKSPGIKECTDRQFDIIKNASPDLEYYDESKLLTGKIDMYTLLAWELAQIKKFLNDII